MYIIGHAKERATLALLQQQQKVPGSILFTGPESVGKRLVAKEFALSLVGMEDFQSTEAWDLPLDICLVEPESVTKRGVTRKKSIGVEEIRESLHFLHISSQAPYRVLIINDAHLLTSAAQNMLLKFVEEPEKRAVVIFVTHERQKLLSTLLSRLFEVRFSFVAEDILKQESVTLDIRVTAELPEFFFRLGRPGILVQAKENARQFAKKKEFLTQLYRLSTLSLKERLSLAEELSKDVPTLIQLFEWFLPGIYARTKEIKDAAQLRKHFLLLESLQDTLSSLKRADAQARLTLEQLFLSLP